MLHCMQKQRICLFIERTKPVILDTFANFFPFALLLLVVGALAIVATRAIQNKRDKDR